MATEDITQIQRVIRQSMGQLHASKVDNLEKI